MATKKTTGSRKRREKKNIERGAAHIQSTFNNTIVTITEMFDHPYDISFILEKDVKAEEPVENEMTAPNQIYGVNYEDAHLNLKSPLNHS